MKTSLRQNINIGYEKYNKLNDVKISASFGVRKIIGVMCSFMNEIESADEILRGSGNSADKNRKPERLEGVQTLLDR